MDQFDLASEFERQERESCLAAALAARPAPGSGPDWVDGKPCCRDCGEAIPLARLEAVPGCGLCVECQARAEVAP